MEANQHQTIVDKKKHEEEEEGETENLEAAKLKRSPTSSPAHEFSFTISLHSSSSSSSSSTTTTTIHDNNNNKKTKTIPPSFAIDLSPADEIFFHGHLLPLHLLSHLPAASPRSSTNSLDSFTLPIEDLKDDNKLSKSVASNNSDGNIKLHDDYHHQQTNGLEQTKGRRPSAKSKSFSLFGFAKWRKGYEVRDQEDSTNIKDQKQKKKLRFDVVSHVIKKYVRMVRPLLVFRGRRENGRHFQRQPYSFSGNLSFRKEQEQMMMIRGGRRDEYSAPASIRTSPTNSGLLVSTANISSSSSSSSSDSTMEELHSAIQAAIAHCKNSIAVEGKLKC